MSDRDTIKDALECFALASEAEADNRSSALEDLRMVTLDQWPQDVRRARETAEGGPRPCLTLDKLSQYCNQVVNQIRANRPSIRVRPVDDQADVKTAELLRGIIRHIETASDADTAYDTAAEHAVKIGWGYWRVLTQYASWDSFSQDIRIARIRNPFTVYVDPRSTTADGSDWQWAFIAPHIPRETFKRMHPKATSTEAWTDKGAGDDWESEKSVRVAEWFKRDAKPVELYMLADGTVVESERMDLGPEEAPEVYEVTPWGTERKAVVGTRTARKPIVQWYMLTSRDVLDTREWAGQHIPIVPCYGNEIEVEGKLLRYGLVRGARDAARMYNYSASAYVERVALAPLAPFVAATEQIQGRESEWADANRVPKPVLTYNAIAIDGQMLPPPMRQSPTDVPSGWASVLQMADYDIQSSMGLYKETLGAPTNASSGRAIIARQQQGDTATFHFTDNVGRAIRRTGEILIDLIPRIYDTETIARIVGEDGTPENAQLVVTGPAYVEQQAPSGEIERLYNVHVGKYDVVVDVGPSYATRRQEGLEMMAQMLQSMPQLGGVIGDLVFRSMDSPYAGDIADRLKKMLPPQLQDAPEGGDPAAQAAAQQAQLMQAMQVLQAKAQELTQAEQALQDRAQALAQAEEALRKQAMGTHTEQMAVDDSLNKLALENQKLTSAMSELHAERDIILAQIEVQAANLKRMEAEAEAAAVKMGAKLQAEAQATAQAAASDATKIDGVLRELIAVARGPKEFITDANGVVTGWRPAA